MKIDPAKVKNILIFSLSNIGDVILTFPVIDLVFEKFPNAKVSVVMGPKALMLFADNVYFEEWIVFDKHQRASKNLKWALWVRERKFDLIIDLRQTAIKLFLMPIRGTSMLFPKKSKGHMREKHLNRLAEVVDFDGPAKEKKALYIPEKKRTEIEKEVKAKFGNQKYIVVSPSAADKAKRWPVEGYIEVCRHWIQQYNTKIILVGNGREDRLINEEMVAALPQQDVLNLCFKATLVQLAAVLEGAVLAFGNDSAPMHMASYLDKPVLTLFGPTDPVKYGPWSSNGHFLKKREMSFFNYKDMDWRHHSDCITIDDVIRAVQMEGDKVVFNR
ncbi:MAG: glycosyltransferase family 9 protein [Candidatus Omnitrophica bacterium]|nr:glycosyltransferase family 9 protein [Candidatus Omnitrophota bacterium]